MNCARIVHTMTSEDICRVICDFLPNCAFPRFMYLSRLTRDSIFARNYAIIERAELRTRDIRAPSEYCEMRVRRMLRAICASATPLAFYFLSSDEWCHFIVKHVSLTGCVPLVEQFFARTPRANFPDVMITAIKNACRARHVALARKLMARMEAKMYSGAITCGYYSALHGAIRGGCAELIDLFQRSLYDCDHPPQEELARLKMIFIDYRASRDFYLAALKGGHIDTLCNQLARAYKISQEDMFPLKALPHLLKRDDCELIARTINVNPTLFESSRVCMWFTKYASRTILRRALQDKNYISRIFGSREILPIVRVEHLRMLFEEARAICIPGIEEKIIDYMCTYHYGQDKMQCLADQLVARVKK